MRNDDEFGPKENTFTIILFLVIILLIVCFINDRENQPQKEHLNDGVVYCSEPVDILAYGRTKDLK